MVSSRVWQRCAREQSARFWSKVRKGVGCWPWQAGLSQDGYGKFAVTLPAVNGKNPQKNVVAHRIAFWLARGIDPKKKVVRHRCDNPRCCRPSHLLIGTQADNRRDCVERGRQPRGEDAWNAKFTRAQVIAIRKLRGVESGRKVAKLLGVSGPTIYAIWTGRNWGWL